MPNMWYINLKAYNSNHSRYCNSIFLRTLMFHNTVTTMLGLAKFLTIRERRRFKLISTSWEFIPNTNPGLPATIALGHLWYNSGTHFAGPYRAAQSGTPDARTFRPSLPLGSVWSPPQGAHNKTGPSLSWITRLRGQNELSGQLSERHAFNLVRSANNGDRSTPKTSMSCCFSIDFPSGLDLPFSP